jgi:hypothetical protein
LHWLRKIGVVGQDRFIGDGRIIKGQRAIKIPIARDPVGVRRMHARQQRHNNRYISE